MTGSISDWGKRHGINRMAALKRVRDHNIPTTRKGNALLVDFEEADRIWNASRNILQQERSAGQNSEKTGALSTLGSIQMQREILRLKREKLETDELEKRLIAVPQVRRYIKDMIIAARSALLPIGAELRDELAVETDPVRIQDKIDGRIHAALRNLAEWKPDAQAA
jgi:hypothetical protein